jgi:hypothetical protein
MMDKCPDSYLSKSCSRGALRREIVVLSVRWYLSFKLSYRDVIALMGERGIHPAHTTILRWIQHYALEFEKRLGRVARQHKHSKSRAPDFVFVNGQVLTYPDSKNPIKNILCKNMTVVQSTLSSDCTKSTGFAVNGAWQLDVYDGSGTTLMTLKPTSNPSCSPGTLAT